MRLNGFDVMSKRRGKEFKKPLYSIGTANVLEMECYRFLSGVLHNFVEWPRLIRPR
jgi:hypothetical protein